MTCEWTALHTSSSYGDLETLILLVTEGADINARTTNNYTPLILAAKGRHKDIVEFLINAGANLNCSGSDKKTVLHYASQIGWADIVQSLLEKGASIEAKTNYGYTPLLSAAYHKHKDIVELLINAGANLNCFDNFKWTVLHYASQNGWLDVVQSLLKKGAGIDEQNIFGSTPLLLAASSRRKETVEFLINAGANLNYFDGDSTVLHYASQYGWLDIVLSLLKKKVDINAKSFRGCTSLHIACKYGRLEIGKQLISAGADVNLAIDYGKSPLASCLDIVVSLLKKKVDCNERTSIDAASLYIACYCRRIEIVKRLISEGADLNTAFNDGTSPLCDLKMTPSINFLRLLIESGAYFNPIDYIILENFFYEEYILKDVNLCCHAIINEFNHKDLPKLYELCTSFANLPCIGKMRIGNNSRLTLEIMQSVEHEIEVKGHCDLRNARPMVLKILAVKSFLSYCNNIRIWSNASNRMKRSPETVSDNQLYQGKIMRFN